MGGECFGIFLSIVSAKFKYIQHYFNFRWKILMIEKFFILNSFEVVDSELYEKDELHNLIEWNFQNSTWSKLNKSL